MNNIAKLNKFEEKDNALVEAKIISDEIAALKKIFTTNPTIDEDMLLHECNKLVKLKNRSKEEEDKKNKLISELAIFHGLNNGALLQTIVGNDIAFKQGIAKIRQDFISEYKCQTPSELMLVDRITAAYWRGMRYETYLNLIIEKEPGKFSFDELKVKILKELHKGIELADRQFETGLTLLQNLKQPRLNVKVTADNAYLAQNQQIINTEEINPVREKSLSPNDLGEFYENTDRALSKVKYQ